VESREGNIYLFDFFCAQRRLQLEEDYMHYCHICSQLDEIVWIDGRVVSSKYLSEYISFSLGLMMSKRSTISLPVPSFSMREHPLDVAHIYVGVVIEETAT
jgi:hypothetical protein